MSRSLRAQVSLLFSDEDLFDNFITPLKENKELAGMIVRLLGAYYNSNEVRNAVEGISYEDVFEGSDIVLDSSEAISQMRQTLAMQDYLFEQAKQTLDDGVTDMDALMRANDIAKQAGVVKTEKTDVGESIVQFSLTDSTQRTQSEEVTEGNDTSGLEGRVGELEKTLKSILSMLQNVQLTPINQSASSQQVTGNIEDLQKSETLIHSSQVLVGQSISDVVLPTSNSTSENLSSDSSNTTEDIPSSVVKEDASDSLNDILGDLLF